MSIEKTINDAFEFYNIDSVYKSKCFKCIDELNIDRFNEIVINLFENDFNDIIKYWNVKDINELFWDEVNPFITNLIILYGYKYHIQTIDKYKFDNNQIKKQKERIKECFLNDLINRKYEGVRISQMLWAIYFIRGRLLEIGILQFEYFDYNNIKIHIPKGNRLYIDDVLTSIKKSRIEIKKYYNISNYNYTCNSWILSKELNEIIDSNSNIANFYNLFNVKTGGDCLEDILNFVYNLKECNDYSLLEENTKLQKIIKYELLNNKKLYLGLGVLKNGQENVG